MRLSADFSAEILQAGKEYDIVKGLKEKRPANQEHFTWQNYPSAMKER